ncbi:GNAT family N-acetyltransferase [Alteromonas sp. H39]|uniref:GNAT family N-acetyltransferase n=1 Tax=Alteromonas sp. H39 TaxID=3389876 RepID=UPI0039E14F8F
MTAIKIVLPDIAYQQSYCEYIDELGEEERYPFPLDFDHSDFPAMLTKIADFAAGRHLPEGYVPSTTYWLIIDGVLAGVSNLRHFLNAGLQEAGGHIGLGIRPSFRGQQWGAYLMQKTVDIARERGIDDVHIHCYADNAASAATIRRCGGELLDIVSLDTATVARYIVSQQR